MSMTNQKKLSVRKIKKPAPKPVYNAIKRLFDIIGSLTASVILFLPMLIIAVIIKLDSEGPVFYKQERLGLNGKPIYIWKYRSMYTDAEKDGPQWAKNSDDRCTRIGRFLRSYHLDEIPQIPFNILLGSLSFVGPRPERKYFYDLFDDYIDGFEQRMYVKPGLAGWAQVNGGYDLLPEEKIIYDLEYIEKQSLWLDIVILFKTIPTVLGKKGSR